MPVTSNPAIAKMPRRKLRDIVGGGAVSRIFSGQSVALSRRPRCRHFPGADRRARSFGGCRFDCVVSATSGRKIAALGDSRSVPSNGARNGSFHPRSFTRSGRCIHVLCDGGKQGRSAWLPIRTSSRRHSNVERARDARGASHLGNLDSRLRLCMRALRAAAVRREHGRWIRPDGCRTRSSIVPFGRRNSVVAWLAHRLRFRA